MPKHIFAACHNLSATILFGIGSVLAAGVSGQVSAEPANRIASDLPPPVAVNQRIDDTVAPVSSSVGREGYTGTPVDGQGIRRKQQNNDAPAAINSPRDPATGQATSVVQSGQGPGSGTAGQSFHIEVDGASGGYVSSYTGSPIDGQGIRRKQPRNKTRKGRRMHKP